MMEESYDFKEGKLFSMEEKGGSEEKDESTPKSLIEDKESEKL